MKNFMKTLGEMINHAIVIAVGCAVAYAVSFILSSAL